MQRRWQSGGPRPRSDNRKNRGVLAREVGDVDNGNIMGCRGIDPRIKQVCSALCLTYMLLIKVKIKI